MGINKQFSGYRSFDYLKTTRDFREFELVEGHCKGEPYLLPLAAEQAADSTVEDPHD